MSTEENKNVVRRLYETINEAVSTGKLELLDAIIAPNVEDHNPAPGQGSGIDGVRQAFGMSHDAFPDMHITVEDMIAEGDLVVARVTARGTNTGEFAGIPATGKQFAQTGIDILRVAKGKVVERWGAFDDLGLLQQLGAIPERLGK